jgi:hypothetical protein
LLKLLLLRELNIAIDNQPSHLSSSVLVHKEASRAHKRRVFPPMLQLSIAAATAAVSANAI